MNPIDAVSPITDMYKAIATQWFNAIQPAALWLFNSLVTAEIVTTLMLQVSGGAFFWTILADRLFRLCVFRYVLVNAGWLIPAVINGFIQVGAQASSEPSYVLNPGAILGQGLDLSGAMGSLAADWSMLAHPFSVLLIFFCVVFIFLSYLVIALQALLTTVESYVVLGGGTLLLGFGGWHGTSDIARRVITYTVAVGVKLMLLTLLVGAGNSLAKQWQVMIPTISVLDFDSMLTVAGSCAAFALICWKVPSLTSSLLTSSLGFGMHEVVHDATALTRTASTVVSGGGSVVRTAAHATSSGYSRVRDMVRGMSSDRDRAQRETAEASFSRMSRGIHNSGGDRQRQRHTP